MLHAYVHTRITTFICAVLLYKFHPFRQHKLQDFDSQLIFASALWILTDMGVTQYLVNSIKTRQFM